MDEVLEAIARTPTEADLLAVAGLTGDDNSIDTDAEFSRAGGTAFTQRVVHGILDPSTMTGLLDRGGNFDGTAIAMLGIDGWRFERPSMIGDTLRVRMTTAACRRTSSRDPGIVERRFELVDQRDDVVQSGNSGVMVRCQTTVPEARA